MCIRDSIYDNVVLPADGAGNPITFISEQVTYKDVDENDYDGGGNWGRFDNK